MGIMPHLLDITRLTISTKKVKLAWVSFSKSRTVNEIFRLAVLNGNMTKFNAFPQIPGKAMARKEGLEKILKSLQTINNQLRYQIQLGKNDLEVMVKIHKEFDYKPYRKVEIKNIDPNNDVPLWDLTSRKSNPQTERINPFDAMKTAGKRGATESPEGHKSKRGNIDHWQVQEYLWAYLEGTITEPNYTNLMWDIESNRGETTETPEDVGDEESDNEDEEETSLDKPTDVGEDGDAS